jgi:hypothetical protein
MWRNAAFLLIVSLAAALGLTRRRLSEAEDEIARLRLEAAAIRDRQMAPPVVQPQANEAVVPAPQPDLAAEYEQAVPPKDS